MVKHIVMWKLKEEEGGKSKLENALIIKEALLKLPSKISEIKSFEVGIDDKLEDENTSDVVLISSFENYDSLNAYQIHSAHQEVVSIIKPLVSERRLVDYTE